MYLREGLSNIYNCSSFLTSQDLSQYGGWISFRSSNVKNSEVV